MQRSSYGSNLRTKNGIQQVRVSVPEHLRPYFDGKKTQIISLGRMSRSEARKLQPAALAEINARLASAEKGLGREIKLPTSDYFLISLDFLKHVKDSQESNQESNPDYKIQYSDDSLVSYLAKSYPDIRPNGYNYKSIKAYVEAFATVVQADMKWFSTLGITSTADIPPMADFPSSVIIPSKATSAGPTFEDVLPQYIQERQLALGSIDVYKSAFRKLSKFVGTSNMEEIQDTDLIAWKRSMIESGRKPRDINKKFGIVRSVYAYALENKILKNVKKNPCDGIRNVPVKDDPDNNRQECSLEQAQLILRRCNELDDPAVKWSNWVAAYSGCRISEVVDRNKCDVMQIDGYWVLKISKAKTAGSNRILPLHRDIINNKFLEYVD